MSQAMRMLLAEGLISRQQLDRATFLQATQGATIDYHLIGAGAITSDQLVRFLVRRFPVVHWPRSRFENLSRNVVDCISPKLAFTLRIVPLSRSGNTVILGLTDPSRHHAIQEAAHYSGAVVQPVVVSHTDMNWALARYYPGLAGELADGDVPVPLTQRVTREFESWNGTEPEHRAPPPVTSQAPPERRVEAIPLVNRAEVETRPLRPSSEPATKAWGDTGVVKREAVVVGSRPARSGAAGPVKTRGPAVEATPVRQAVSSKPVRKIETTPAAKAAGARSAPSRSASPSRSVVAEPIRTIGDRSRELARQASKLVPEYDSWTPPEPTASPRETPKEIPKTASSPAPKPSRSPRRRAHHPLSRPRTSRAAAEPRSSPATPTRRSPEPEIVQPDPPRRRTEGELIAAIDQTGDRDQIVGLALEYLRRFAGRAVFFVVKSSEIRGFDIVGELTSRDAIRSFWIPTASPSTLRTVVSERRIHFGSLGSAPADAVLAAALGGRPERSMIVPVTIRDRVVGLLFADRLDIDSPPWNRLERLAKAVGENLGRLISRGGRS
jgi:hypothetical protein